MACLTKIILLKMLAQILSELLASLDSFETTSVTGSAASTGASFTFASIYSSVLLKV